MLNKTDIFNAYKFILGREPENDKVVESHLKKCMNVTELRNRFLSSREFLIQFSSIFNTVDTYRLYPLIVRSPYLLHAIELTNHCPMSCIMCPRPRHMTRTLGFMDMKLFKSVIDQFVADNPDIVVPGKGWQGTCLHHFGESLLHPTFDEAIAYAQGKGLDVCISFNPVMLTPEKAHRLFKAKPAVLFAMVDGFDETSFAKIPGGGYKCL